MKKSFNSIKLSVIHHGFTLIELLVVIAIIGILAAMVLVSLSSARAKAKDARVRASLSGFKTTAQMYNLENNGNYSAICDSPTLQKFEDDINGQGGNFHCHNTTDKWAVISKLPSAGTAAFPGICIDSTGTTKEYKTTEALIYNNSCATDEQIDLALQEVLNEITLMQAAAVTATPTFSVAPGGVLAGTTVIINSEGYDAVYYTTNGSTPTTASTNQAITPLVINSAMTVNAIGVKSGYPDTIVSSVNYTLVSIGSNFQGGKLAYILQSGDPGYDPNVKHGLIATVSDISTNAPWGCGGTLIAGADGTAIGTGNQNTIDIVNGCAEAGTAARLAYNLVQGGYSDWYLPSRDELNKLYINRVAIGNFSNSIYWTSSEQTIWYVFIVKFSDGTVPSGFRTDTATRTRAVRSF